MFGNRFSVDNLAGDFLKELDKIRSFKKESNLKSKSASDVKPEDFLISQEEDTNVYDKDLNDKIDSISNYADEEPCDICHEEHEEHQVLEKEIPMDMDTKSFEDKDLEDISYLVDKKAKYVLHRLGKIASSLRKKNEAFAADMVELTAIDIKNETIAKAAQKIQVIDNLKKMANKSYSKGDQLTGDVISSTIESIKKAR
jgi:uncharacterized protein YqeY